MRILVFDLETSPNLAHIWQMHGEQHISLEQLQVPTEVLCFAARWLGEDDVMFHAQWQRGGRDRMVKAMHRLLEEADAVVHYNGRRFDVPHMNREFARLGMWPPSPFKQIDLLATVKSRFQFPSNKLAYVAPYLGCEAKAETGGHELWVKVMAGQREAERTMEEYNRQDVVVTEQLYHKLLPWLAYHPNRQLYGETGCPRCGGDNLMRRGYAYTGVSRFVKLQCQGCGSYSRKKERIDGVEERDVSLNG